MAEPTYPRALDDARRERDDLRRQTRELSERIEKLEHTISALAALCGEPLPVVTGFTDAVRHVLRNAYPNGLMPTTVRRLLQESGFPLSEYGNPGASIHTILKRLEKSGEARRGRRASDGVVFYVWISKEATSPKR